jgi:nitrogen regulatory protein PII
MKKIEAYIKPHKLDNVTMAIQKLEGLRGMSVVDVRGFGRGEERTAPHPRTDDLMDFAHYVRIEIFCKDELVEELVSVIDRTAYTGLRGDGKIYVLDVEKAFKIGRGAI